ncbi:MAG: family 16 glycosylhydrolase [Polyangiaceae bacterium]
MRSQLCSSVACIALVVACSSGSDNPSSGGIAGSNSPGGAASGGASTAGAGTGTNNAGASNAGTGNAGTGNAGTSNGGASSGASNGDTAGAPVGGAAGNSAAGSAGTAGAAGAATTGCSSASAGYSLVWSDEFNGPKGTAVDSSKWTFDVGGTGWGNDELEYYTNSTNNAALDGSGNLVIEAKKEAMSGKDYTSARIKTQGIKSFTYGRIEARMKIAQGQGMWPAFWMLGEDIGSNPWPACGEIDIMENIGKEPSVIHATIHGPGYSAGQGPTKQYMLSAPVAAEFHVFAIEWEMNAIRWYVDGTLYSTKTPSDIPSSATWVYAHPFFIVLNLAVGGGWPGNPDGTTTFPQQLQVDYVRVCQK